jgi:hypothetical protein
MYIEESLLRSVVRVHLDSEVPYVSPNMLRDVPLGTAKLELYRQSPVEKPVLIGQKSGKALFPPFVVSWKYRYSTGIASALQVPRKQVDLDLPLTEHFSIVFEVQ